jgi:hypothetical protein
MSCWGVTPFSSIYPCPACNSDNNALTSNVKLYERIIPCAGIASSSETLFLGIRWLDIYRALR